MNVQCLSVKFTLLDTDSDNSNIWEMFCINQSSPEKQNQEGTYMCVCVCVCVYIYIYVYTLIYYRIYMYYRIYI